MSSGPKGLRRRATLLLAAVTTAGVVIAAPGASAYPVHEVAPGETLSGIAAANGMSVERLAAANGVSAGSGVVAGHAVTIPPRDGLYTAPTGQTMGYQTSSRAALASGAGAAPAATTTTAPAVPAVPVAGGTAIAPGETLSAIAARMGVSVQSLAAANGIADPNLIIAGRSLRAPGAGATQQTAQPVASGTSTPTAATGPEGTQAATGVGPGTSGERVSAGEVSSIASQHGVPGNLAAAIAWQESGFNNGLTSSAGARGVMQVMPGTWDWINRTQAGSGLARNSAADNVRAGSLLLRQLLAETGGNEELAIAGYYQGLRSVRERGMYEDTKRYVQNVQSLRSRFG